MKSLLLILLTPFTLFGQITRDVVEFASPHNLKAYKSKVEDTYYENRGYQQFRPQPIEVVKSHGLKHIKILLTPDGAFHQVNESISEKLERDIEFLDPKNSTGESGGRKSLMSYTNSKGTIASVFLDSKYDEFIWGEPGYWINLTDKGGSRDFYTGLTQNYYIRLLDSGKNIWRNDSTLVIDAVRVRLVEPFIHPVSAPKYETLDRIRIELSVSDLMSDSDSDGLSDVEEDKMMLNPFSKDTDGDGTTDYEDHNPRFKSRTTNETLIYKAILDNYIGDTIRIRNNSVMDSKRPRLIGRLKSRTRLIVTDDLHLQNVELDYDRTIIVSTNDYQSWKAKYPVTLDETNVSPLFKVDDMPDAFVVSVSTHLGGGKYLIRKVANGFDIVRIESWIH